MPRAMAEGRSGGGQVRWHSVVGWERQAASANGVAEAKNSGRPSDELLLVYLVELDGEAEDESVDPGEFPPVQT